MKVLLISPLDPDVPGNLKFLMGGENTYTRTLSANPPQEVEYVHHIEALKKGLIEYLPIHKALGALMKFKVLPPSAGVQAISLKSDFDLIHVHAYSLKINANTKKKIPIVISDSSSNYLFLRDYLHWSNWRLKLAQTIKKFIFSKLDILDSEVNLRGAFKLIVFSKFAEKIHTGFEIRKKKIKVIYPGLPPRRFKKVKKRGGINILFVGVWFERKGGAILLEAFTILSREFPNIRLTILGPVPKKNKLKNLKIVQHDFVPYSRLIAEFYPQTDIFVLVPPLAEGYGLVVEEAASFGIPAVVSGVYALPELVEDGVTGFVVKPGSVTDLVDKLKILIKNESLRKKFGRQALMKFTNQFSIEKSNQKLLEVYLRALRENIRGASSRLWREATC